MTYEEALEKCKDELSRTTYLSETSLNHGIATINSNKASFLSVVCRAIEKQIPKKPIHQDTKYLRSLNDYLCPSCKRYVERGHRCHYNDCGQAIDWGETK